MNPKIFYFFILRNQGSSWSVAFDDTHLLFLVLFHQRLISLLLYFYFKILKTVLRLHELLIEMIRRQSFLFWVFLHYLMFILIPFSQMNLIARLFLQRQHQFFAFFDLFKFLADSLVNTKDIFAFLFFFLQSAIFYLFKIRTIFLQHFPFDILFTAFSILLLRAAFPNVDLFEFVGDFKDILNIDVDLSLFLFAFPY